MIMLALAAAALFLTPIILRLVIGGIAVLLAAMLWRHQRRQARALVAGPRVYGRCQRYEDRHATRAEGARLAAGLASTMEVVLFTSLLPQASVKGALLARRFD